MADFTYQCPHCGETTSVGLESLGKPALCRACAKPYLAEVPAGRLMVDGGEAGLVPADRSGAQAAEQTVLTVNPAAFRERPVQTLVLAGLILAGLTGLIMFVGETSQGIVFAVLVAFSALVTVAAALVLAGRFVLSRFESLTITTQRSVWARGVINRRSSEVQHDDIRNIQVQQDLVQRLVGAGTIAISSAGQDDMEIVARGFANPHGVIETIRTHQRRMVKDD
ncbi:MAG: PH domain-containing protein [Phycisphaeraceae bacterium]